MSVVNRVGINVSCTIYPQAPNPRQTLAFVSFCGFLHWSNLNSSMPTFEITNLLFLKKYICDLLGIIVSSCTMSLMWSGSFLETTHNALIFCVIATFFFYNLISLSALICSSMGFESSFVYSVSDVGENFCAGVHTTLVLEYAFEIMYVTCRPSIFQRFCGRNDFYQRKWKYVGIALFVPTILSILLWSNGLPDNKCNVYRSAFEQSNQSRKENERNKRHYLYFVCAFTGASFVLILYTCKQMMTLVTTQRNNVRALACKLIPVTFIMAVPYNLPIVLESILKKSRPSFIVGDEVRDMYGVVAAIYIVWINKLLKERFVACCCSRCIPRRKAVSEEEGSERSHSYVELQDTGE